MGGTDHGVARPGARRSAELPPGQPPRSTAQAHRLFTPAAPAYPDDRAPPGANVLGGPRPPRCLGEYSYNPSGRRDPFAVVLKEPRTGEAKSKSPSAPTTVSDRTEFDRHCLGRLRVQRDDASSRRKGYTVRQGTRVGPNGGAVSSITENALVVQERFTDVMAINKCGNTSSSCMRKRAQNECQIDSLVVTVHADGLSRIGVLCAPTLLRYGNTIAPHSA